MSLESVRFGANRKADLVNYLDHEMMRALGFRQPLERMWRGYLEQYRAPFARAYRDVPYEGASALTLPLTRIDVDQLYAYFMQTIHAPSNLWTISPLNERWTRAAKPVQDLLEWLDHRVLKMRRVNSRVLMDMVKLGTGIYKVGWHYSQQRVLKYDETGRPVQAMVTTSRPTVDHVKLSDFLLPPECISHQPDEQGGAPWVAERVRMPKARLAQWAAAGEGYYPGIDQDAIQKVLSTAVPAQADHDRTITDLDYLKRATAQFLTTGDPGVYDGPGEGRIGMGGAPMVDEVEFWEIHVRYGAQSDRNADDLVVWYEPHSHTVLRAILNPYAFGARPYEVVRYMPTEGFYGIGVCEQKEMFQHIQSELLNYQMDNALLANARVFVAKQGSSLMPGDTIWPGRVIVTEGDPRAEFGTYQLGDIYSSLPATFQQFQAIGERSTGIGDIQLGNIDALPSRTPATSLMSMLAEGRRRPDFILNNLRSDGLAVVGLRVLQLMQQFATSAKDIGQDRMITLAIESLGLPEGEEVAAKLYMPMEDASLGLGVSLTATGSGSNKEVDRQQKTALLQLGMQIAPQAIQLAQTALVAQQQGMIPVAAVASSSLQGLIELYRRVLESYDERDVEALIPPTDEAIGQSYAQQVHAAAAVGADPSAGGQFGAVGGQPGLGGAGVGGGGGNAAAFGAAHTGPPA